MVQKNFRILSVEQLLQLYKSFPIWPDQVIFLFSVKEKSTTNKHTLSKDACVYFGISIFIHNVSLSCM